jgi:hypothetical protein
VTDIYYDTEFIEAGPHEPLRFLSIGLVADDGREYYAVTADPDVITAAVAHDWLRVNVVPSLPVTVEQVPWGKAHGWSRWQWEWDRAHPDYRHVKDREQIAVEVRDFILAEPDPRLWAWYAAYDHVVLCQLYGPMISLPAGMPMWTNDLKQEAVRRGDPHLPAMPGVRSHNALDDAREVQYRRRLLHPVSRSEEGTDETAREAWGYPAR